MLLTRQDRSTALGLFVLISSVYFATITGVTSSNDGSHYALVRAIVERGSFEISPYLDYTEHQDYAFNGDRFFSDRPPGTALLTAPFYVLGSIGPVPLADLPSRHDAGNPRMMYAVAASALMGGASIVLFFMTVRQFFGISLPAAALTSLALAFGTTMWKYGSVLYSHAAAGLIIWLVLYLILKAEYDGALRPLLAFALGFVLGFAPLTEYTSLPFSILAGLYLVVAMWLPTRAWLSDRETRPRQIASLIGLAVGALLPAIFILIYNTANFGGPFEVSTFHVDTTRWPQNEGMAADFATPLLEGLSGVLFWHSNGNQGLFLLAPITLLAAPGLVPFYRQSRRHFLLFMGIFVSYLLLFSKSTTFNAATNDGRYLTTFIGLWFVPLAFWVDRYLKQAANSLTFIWLSLLVFGLLFLSIRNQIAHIAFSWNYLIDPARLEPLAASPANILYLTDTVFRNAPNLLLLWLGEGLGIMAVLFARRWRRVEHVARVTNGQVVD